MPANRAHVLPSQELVLSEIDNKPVSWMETARTGKFKSNRYGRFEISLSDLDQANKNINASAGAIPVDYDHLMMRPQSPGDGKAAGWFQKSELRENGKQLWGLIEWTPKAAEHIRNKEYRYCSPVIVPNAEDNETEEKLGTHIPCAALTNVPFIKGMSPIALSANSDITLDFTTSDQEEVASNPESTMPEDKNQPPATDPKVLELSQQLNTLDGVVKELSKNLELEKTARVAAETKSAQLETQIKTDKAQSRVLSLIRDTKLAKKQEEWAVSYCLSDPEGFEKFAATLEKGAAGVKIGTEHGSGEGDEEIETKTTQSAGAKLFALCHEYVEKNGGKDKVKFLEALSAVSKEHPQLALDYRAEQVATAS